MRRGIPFILLIILPVFLFGVKPVKHQLVDDKAVMEHQFDQHELEKGGFFAKLKHKTKRFKNKLERFSAKFEGAKKPASNLLFSSVFLFFSGAVLILAVQNSVFILGLIGVAAIILSGILSFVAFRRRKGKNFLVEAWFYFVGLPVVILFGVSIGAFLVSLLFI